MSHNSRSENIYTRFSLSPQTLILTFIFLFNFLNEDLPARAASLLTLLRLIHQEILKVRGRVMFIGTQIIILSSFTLHHVGQACMTFLCETQNIMKVVRSNALQSVRDRESHRSEPHEDDFMCFVCVQCESAIMWSERGIASVPWTLYQSCGVVRLHQKNGSQVIM